MNQLRRNRSVATTYDLRTHAKTASDYCLFARNGWNKHENEKKTFTNNYTAHCET